MPRTRNVQTPNSPSAEATAEANDKVEQEQAAAQLQEAETPTPAPEFSEEQREYLKGLMAEAAKSGYDQGRADAAHREAAPKTSASNVANSKDVDPTKITKAVLTEVGYICPMPKPRKSA